jgi:hypothetical protein
MNVAAFQAGCNLLSIIAVRKCGPSTNGICDRSDAHSISIAYNQGQLIHHANSLPRQADPVPRVPVTSMSCAVSTTAAFQARQLLTSG